MRIRGQVSIEFLIIIGIAMLMTIPLTIIYFKQSQTLNADIAGTQADKIASEIRDAADEVYYLGPPSKKTIIVFMPKNVEAITLYETSIIFNVTTDSGDFELVKWSAANFSAASSLEAKSGIRKITAEAINSDAFGNVAVLLTDS